MRSQLHSLELVYPPISNQEAEWLKNDIEVIEQIKKSKLYFIAQKDKTEFTFKENVQDVIQEKKSIEFSLNSVDNSISGSINIENLLTHHNIQFEDYDDIEIELGPKLVRLWLLINNEKEVLDWFTTEKILNDFSKFKNIFIYGLKNYREFTKYDLHYIGISKKDDSFKRLVIKPHDKRLRILSNEYPKSKNSRITDEMFLFFFDIDSLEIKQYLQDTDFDEFGKNELEDRTRIIVDAEKAFVKVLNAEYNEVKFKQYPVSTDGLYKSSVERYSFSLNEDIEFMTKDNSIYGERNDITGNSQADFISIDKESKEVKLNKIKNNVA
ncbi:hypothetical protein [Tenacibaculum piscium]|uniref:hypothetical protein n=1 Tax=Tenacibaculum piscium TaxID=1458515 RepID=UPI001F1B706F|nr:hypothetical protein [Tenacibaculum piscium]